jgi:hypothetical protein
LHKLKWEVRSALPARGEPERHVIVLSTAQSIERCVAERSLAKKSSGVCACIAWTDAARKQ